MTKDIDALVAAADALAEIADTFADAADECDDYGYDDFNQAPVTAGECREARELVATYRAAREAVRKGTPPAFATSA